MQMSAFARRRPRELSGGQQQRVALARALAIEPGILLLDEPFAALDKNLRLDMQIELKRLQRELGLTAILVTHDQEEAMSVADRVAVMNHGRIEQLGSPVDVYDRPDTLFVNAFVGSSNLLPGTVALAQGGEIAVDLDAGARIVVAGRGAVGAGAGGAREAGRENVGARVLVSVRPEQLEICSEPGPDRFAVRCRLEIPVGGTMVLDLVARDGTALKLVRMRAGAPPLGEGPLYCALAAAARPAVFPAEPDPADLAAREPAH